MASRSRSTRRPPRPDVAGPTGRTRRRFRFHPSLLALESRTLLTTFTVSNTNDSGSGSLRYELSLAKDGDIVNFAPSLFSGDQHQTIDLTTGGLDVNFSVSIQGPEADFLTIDGDDKVTIMTIAAGTDVHLSGLTLSDGKAFPASSSGGAIENFGALNLVRCTISGSTAHSGGGIENYSTGSLSLFGCTLSNNTAVNTRGGAIDSDGPVSMYQCTVADNSAHGAGGGIFTYGKLLLDGCTVSGNSAGSYGGIVDNGQSGTMDNTIVAGNTGGDISSPLPYSGDGNLIGGNPKLGTLAYNGGPTQTMAPLAGSPAIGNGDSSVDGGLLNLNAIELVDQRGAPRTRGGKVDIGAVESGPLTFTVNTQADQSSGPIVDGSTISLRQAVGFAVVDPYGDGDSIVFDIPGSTQPFTTIALSGPLPTITSDLTIDGASNNQPQSNGFYSLYAPIAISGSNQYQILNISSGANVELEGLSLTDGSSSLFGGAILNQGTLTITNSTSLNSRSAVTISTITNSTSGEGGAIFNEGTLTISAGSTISGCSVTNAGGAIFNEGMLTISSGSTISGCSAETAGGAIANLGSTVVIKGGSSITGNQAPVGGAIDQTGVLDSGSLTITGSTVSNNMALGSGTTPGFGGALDIHSGNATLDGATLSGNTAQGASGGTGAAGGAAEGGAIVVSHDGSVTITDSTLLSGNTAQGGHGGAGGEGETADGGAVAITGGGGAVTITGSTLSGNKAQGGQGGAAQAGTAAQVGGTAIGGAIANPLGGGSVKISDSTLSGNKAQGGQGGAGLFGRAGAKGGAADGGAIGLTNGGGVTITSSTLSGNKAQGGEGGSGSAGANGANEAEPSWPQSGARGWNGRSGGQGGGGGMAAGAGLYLVGGTLDLIGSTLADNVATGGTGGPGGAGGAGGHGGTAENAPKPTPYDQNTVFYPGAPGGAGGSGAAGGPAGPGGSALGGGLYVQAGAMIGLINATLAKNQVEGGAGGNGGAGGAGGNGGNGSIGTVNGEMASGVGGAGGNAANGGDGGAVGDATGAGLENDGGTLTVHDATIADNQAIAGALGPGGAPGALGFGGLDGSGIGILVNKLNFKNGFLTGLQQAPKGYIPPNGNPGNWGATSTSTPVVLAGGIAADSGDIALVNTLVAANTALGSASDISGTVDTSHSSYNLIGTGGAGGLSDGASGNQVGVADPGIDMLGDHGGSTQTIALLSTSPAIAAGNPTLATDAAGNSLTTDQRGDPRFIAGFVDIGAYEWMPQSGSPLVVTSLSNNLVHMSLFVAARYASAVGGAQTISFAPGLSGTITLGGSELTAVTGNLTIQGNSQVTISGAGESRIFEVDTGGTLALAGLTLTQGYSSSDGGAILVNVGTLDISDSTIESSTASTEGGAIENSGGTVVIDSGSLITGNHSGTGGAIANDNSGSLTISDSTLSNNQAGTGGALVVNSGTVTLEENTTLSGNIAAGSTGISGEPADGGAIAIDGGSVTITHSTISGNTAQGGNGAFAISGSGAGGAGSGGGIAVSGGALELFNSLVENNLARGGEGGSGGGGVTQLGFHLYSVNPGSGGAGTGGGIAVSGGTVDLISSLAANNDARGGTGGAGGVFPTPFGNHVSITPEAGGAARGGGLYVSNGILSVTDSIAANNTAHGGSGGVALGSGSSGGAGPAGGGGIAHDGGTLYLINATLAYNQSVAGSGTGTRAAGGGGLAAGNGAGNGVNFAAPAVSLANTLVALNTAGGSASDISGSVGTQPLYSQNNLIGTGGSGGLSDLSNGNLVGVANPDITQLVPGNGPNGLETVALLFNSPAITAGSVSRAVDRSDNPLTTDETGNPRILEGDVDIGAFEAGTQSLVVTTLVDQDYLTSNPALGAGTSLREAINYAQEQGGTPAITFAPGLSGTMTLDGSELCVITGNVSIVGPGAQQLTISGNWISQILDIALGATASVSGLTFANASPGVFLDGGAIVNDGTLTVSSSNFASNAAADGGGIYSDGTLTVNNCTFDGNSVNPTFGNGGAIDNDGTLTVKSSTFDSNSACYGGGIYNTSTLTVDSSTLDSNSATEDGGGIDNNGNLLVTNSTFWSNSAGYRAGGIYNGSALSVTSSTVYSNSGFDCGGIYTGGNRVNLTNTIVAANKSTSQFAAATADVLGGYSGGSDFVGGNPMLGPPSFNGGPTQTLALLPGSTAIGQGGAVATLASSGVVDTTTTSVTLAAGSALPGWDLPAVAAGDYFVIQVDSERMAVTALTYNNDGTITLSVVRGASSTNPATHAGGAPVWLAFDQRGMPRASAAASDIGAFQTEPGIVVNTPLGGDSTPLGDLSLPQAVNLANVLGAAATITFDPTAFASHQTIALNAGPLVLTNSGGLQTITGPAAGVTISAGGSSGVFWLLNGVPASLSGLTISGGSDALGGGIYDEGANLTLTECTISGNTAAEGGGVFDFGGVTLNDCTLSHNYANGNGGALYNGYGVATLSGCTISGNTAWYNGGGVDNAGGTLSLAACTVSANSDTQPVSGSAAGIYTPAAGTTNLNDTIVAGNTDPSGSSDIGGLGTATGSNNLIGGNPLLGPLGDYGGPTQTMPLLLGSPAIGNGLKTGQNTDQRGFPLDSPNPDIGAFQTQPSGPLVVTSAGDYGAPAGRLDLRGAVDLAGVLGAAATITFDPTAFAAHQTIALTAGPLVLSATGGLQTITGPAAGVTISGGGSSDVLQVEKSVTASLSGLTFTGGSGAPVGAIFNYGDLTLAGCTISGNSGEVVGGIGNVGELVLTACTVSGNSGGGAGGIGNYGQMTLTASTISGNSGLGSDGGGVYNYGTATLTDCTVSGNSARWGGGLFDEEGTLTLTACTISGNSAGVGGGGAYIAGFAALALGDTILAGNTAGTQADLEGSIATDLGHNLIGGTPLLAALGNYGGPTQTMPLLPGSPAIETGAAMGQTTDQRGMHLDSPNPDIGAFQSQGFTLTVTTGSSPQATLIGIAFANPLALTVTAKNSIEPVAGGIISFSAPQSGARAVLSSGSATIGSNGTAAITAAANDITGAYVVMASPGGAVGTSFDLTNETQLWVNSIALVTPNPRTTPVSTIAVTFSVPVNPSTFSASSLTLTDNSRLVAITSAVSLSLVSGSTYDINGVAGLTMAQGNYSLTVNASAIDDTYGNPGTGSQSTSWLMDTTPPTSTVNPLPARGTSLTFPVSVTGSDGGSPASGVKSYNIYSSTNGGAWSLWTTVSASTPSANFTGQSNTTYAFYSTATDNAGNTQACNPQIEASTYLPDLTPPVTVVNGTTGTNPSTVNSATGTFTLNLTGSDPGGAVVTYFEVFVSVDSGPFNLIGPAIPAGPAGSTGSVQASIPYQGLTDGAQHTYAFYSIGFDSAGNVQTAPKSPNVTFTETFANALPSQLATTALVVEDGAVERSFIRYLQVDFNESDSQSAGELTQIVNSLKTATPEIQLYQYDLNDDASSKTAVSLSGVTAQVIDDAIELDFGAGGLGGSPTTTAADGYYEVDIKLPNGTTAVHHFYRLLGDVTGDGTVDQNDLNEIAAEINLSNPTGFAPLGADVTGGGTVTALDLTLATRAKGHKLTSGLSLG